MIFCLLHTPNTAIKKTVLFLLFRFFVSSSEDLKKKKKKWKNRIQHTLRWRPEGVFQEEACSANAEPFTDFVSARTSTLTGFLSPALASSSTAWVWVAEKRPVLRSFGNRAIIEVICLWNPKSKSLSASSRIRTYKQPSHTITHTHSHNFDAY